jgi:hypothetical protein
MKWEWLYEWINEVGVGRWMKWSGRRNEWLPERNGSGCTNEWMNEAEVVMRMNAQTCVRFSSYCLCLYAVCRIKNGSDADGCTTVVTLTVVLKALLNIPSYNSNGWVLNTMCSWIAPDFKLAIAFSCDLSFMWSLKGPKRLVKEYVYIFECRTLQCSQFKVTPFRKLIKWRGL